MRRQVFSILAAYDEEASFLERLPAALLVSAPEASAGDRIGLYRLVEKKGEGGMGAVFLASRADDSYAKLVAIKLLKRGWGGAAELKRFRVERQILADLEHPNIAKLLDGGSTEGGQPYLVMEYVEGQPIDQYCEERQLPLENRLQLFLEVCAAVQFAHQNLIVHRDLKPGNILVGADGRPRLLDFGIAKILSPEGFSEPIEETAAGIAPMTPHYASPEQIRGAAITTASDIYSLGVILYRLLAGQPPYSFDSRDMKAIVEAVCQREVPPPSERVRQEEPNEPAKSRQLRGDLDAIVLKAMAKEPARRYAAAEQLADDIRRYLGRQPVRARGGAAAYRAGKFIRRHRLGLGAALLVFLVLIGAVLLLLDQRRDLIAERNRVVSERNRAETVSSWMVELFGLPDPGRALGEKVTARELLDKGNATIRSKLASQPELLGTLLGTLGETYANLGQLPEARDIFTSSVRYLRSTGAGDGKLAEVLLQLAQAQSLQGKLLAARKTATTALLHAERAAGIDPAMLIRCQTLLAHIEQLMGELGQSEQRFEEALRAARSLADPPTLAHLLEYRAELQSALGNTDEAFANYQESLEIQRKLLDPGHPRIAQIEAKQASLRVQVEPARAEQELRQKLARQRQLYGEDHPFLVGTLGNLGLALLDQGKAAEAERCFTEALAMARKVYGEQHNQIAALLVNLGLTATQRGDLKAADRSYREALAIQRREKGERNPIYARYTHYLAQLELDRGRRDEARALTEKALEITRDTLGERNLQTLMLLSNLAEIRRQDGHVLEARDLLARAAAIGRLQPGWSSRLRPVLYSLGTIEFDLRHFDPAQKAFEEVVASEGYDPNLGLWAATYLALVENELGRHPAAEKWARQAVAGYEKTGGGDQDWAISTRRELGAALFEQGKLDEAELELARCLRGLAGDASMPNLEAKLRQDLAAITAARQAASTLAPDERRKEP